MSPAPSTRERLLAEGMRLFGEQGYAATSIAQIEAAAGLAPGSGSLYKHFRSKEQLLAEGLEGLLASSQDLMTVLAQQPDTGPDVQARLSAAASAGLHRMQQDRDLNRLLFRGLDAFPGLMRRFRDGEIKQVHAAVTDMLAQLGAGYGVTEDWAAVAAVLVGAVAHYWLLADLFGVHPSGVGEDRYAAAAARLATALIAGW